MDLAPGNRHPGQRRKKGPKPAQNPQLFDDTSSQLPASDYPPPQYGQSPDVEIPQLSSQPPWPGMYNQGQSGGGYYPQQQQWDQGGQAFPGQQYLNDPMANMAMQYGTTLADQGKDIVNQNLEKYMSTSKLKYYFAVDTAYVGKKLGLLLFPFAHTDWTVKYNQDEPVAPRYDVNAPDLYIPVMAFVTYILLAGIVLGTQDRFTPETLGMTSSTALVWLVIEILVLLFSMYILQVSTDLKYLDLISYCGYKYVGMILVLLGGLMFQSTGYYLVLLWCSITICFFLVRSLKMAIIPHSESEGFTQGSKRRLYTLLVVALTQPLFMWWLTRSVAAP